MKFSTTGLIIKQQNIGEQDRLVTVLSENGVLRAFVRRAKNIKSPKCASTGLLCYSKLLISEHRNSYNINEAESIEMFIGLRKSIDNTSLAQYFCELCIHLCPKESEAKEFLRLMLNSLYLLSNNKKDPLLIKFCFEMRLISMCGYMPDLVMCDICGEYEKEQMLFVPKTGKLYCKSCADHAAISGVALNKSGVLALRHAVYSDLEKLFAFEVSNELLTTLNFISENYITLITERTFQTLQFYKDITKGN